MAVPSILSPVVVTFTPPSDASRTVVRLLIGFAVEVDLDLATFRFHVPSELSAPSIPMTVIATPIANRVKIFRIALPSLRSLKLSEVAVWRPAVLASSCSPQRIAGGTLTLAHRPDSISLNQSRCRSYHDWRSL